MAGNDDGAHHVISEVSGALADIGFTIPGQAWAYWNKGPGPGQDYLETDEGQEWSHSTGSAAAANLLIEYEMHGTPAAQALNWTGIGRFKL